MINVLHLGLGRFQRGHQACYYRKLIESGTPLETVGVSLRSAQVREQLQPNDFNYHVWEKGPQDQIHSIKHLKDGLVLSENLVEVLQKAIEADVITITVTEKGYLIDPEDKDPEKPKSLMGLMAMIAKIRKQNQCSALSVVSCDNVFNNGRNLQAGLKQFLEGDSSTLQYIDDYFNFPNTMVDRIVPATTAEDIENFKAIRGVEDRGLVLTEPFSQWVIEKKGSEPLHPLADFGVEIVDDVEPFERMKLRLLNAAHSFMAYEGQLRGHEYVSQAVEDKEIREVIQGLWSEAIPTLGLDPNFDVNSYCDQLLERFENPKIFHKLSQIAMDGPQKIPIRIESTIADCKSLGLPHGYLEKAVDAWKTYQSK